MDDFEPPDDIREAVIQFLGNAELSEQSYVLCAQRLARMIAMRQALLPVTHTQLMAAAEGLEQAAVQYLAHAHVFDRSYMQLLDRADELDEHDQAGFAQLYEALSAQREHIEDHLAQLGISIHIEHAEIVSGD